MERTADTRRGGRNRDVVTIRKIESCPPRGYVDGPQTWASSTRIQSWVKFGKAHPFIPDLRASAPLGPCGLRNSFESSVPGYPGRDSSGSDPGQASDLALAPVPPQASAPVLGRHAAGVLVAAPAQGLASALAPKEASPVASGVGGPLGRPSSDHGSPVCSTGLWSPPPS
jgi:hypothetical protein